MGIFGVAQAEYDRVSAALAEAEAKLAALDAVQARIEFDPDGTILDANQNFCAAMGYQLSEIQGKHHRIFVDPEEAGSSEYQNFWARLRNGEQIAQEFQRFGKNGNEVWIEASYSPLRSPDGKVFKVVKYAIDITESRRNAQLAEESKRILGALDSVQASIEFKPDGTIVTANENFCAAMGYQLSEIQGKHHRIFADSEFAQSSEYENFWNRLRNGEQFSGEFKRVGKDGNTVWIEASYSPLRDENGKVYKVVKYAIDTTKAKFNAALAAALEVCQANVMVADNNMTITYLNETLRAMMSSNEAKLRTALPNFNASSLVGTCVDVFHKNPAHQRGMIKDLREPYQTDLKLAGLTFGLIATPVIDEYGNRLGTVVEWNDKTQELARLEKEAEAAAVNTRIAAALTVCQANVMIANNDLEIVYINDSIKKMLASNEKKLQSVLPSFNMNGLVGTCVDVFHKNPSHQRGMIANLREPYNTQLNLAGLTFDLIASPVYGGDGERLGTVVEWKDMTEELARLEAEKKIADENKRIRQALDSVSTNAMIADAEYNIVYLNESVINMMRNAERDIRKDLPNFDTNKLLGSSIDNFHKNPAHQRNMLANLTSTYRGEIVVGGRTFSLVGNPIMNDDGDRIGTIVEWADRTAEVAIEKEIDGIVMGAADGDLSGRIELSGKEGFFRSLGEGLNQLVGSCESVIDDMLRVLGAMAKGDLTETVANEYKGKFGQLKENANATIANLTDVIGKISEAAGTVSTAADEMAQGNADLSQRTEEQASALEETASSMEQMTSTVKHSSDNAQEANELSGEAATKATRGGEVVTQAVTAMQGINEASKKIADIIGVIDEIAFQTNLLALNAAVEAARAGEQGRGFAVVAGEVRNLAQRSAAAAKEIKDLIRDSEARVEDGTRLVNDSGTTLQEIVEAVQKVSTTIAQIADAAREQTQGIEQVNKAVSQMDEMTQQNAALVEEASASSESMAEQARNMSNLVSFFRMSGGGDSGGFGAATKGVSGAGGGSGSSAGGRKAAAKPAPKSSDSDDDWEEF